MGYGMMEMDLDFDFDFDGQGVVVSGRQAFLAVRFELW